ncbi:DUF2786 domain-containing protein [Sphingopyxis sp. GW247-27LB]|uniref:DUF7168 domain-containing protein n=1 Tax=Sphingopyxis sp. GW247-27LB TaxID=2012632 RepID=UPI000BA5C71F|nr:DUF2786 domain-containing protein [Sphingopyxis sp. GW247-27LB]PAL23568.1 hypothetical protein CD928_05740 [Sphingopyxis sp. GW247-27LB]
MSQANRATISGRIRALAAKTVENGCTEAEALAAAEALARLLAKYNMTLDEAEMRASPFTEHRERHDDPVGEQLWKIGEAVATLTGAQSWANRPGEIPSVSFFGFDHEVEVAKYMLEICAAAMRRAAPSPSYVGIWTPQARRRVRPFLDGMSDRLASRIRAMKPTAPTGKGLIVLHDALVKQAMEDAGHRLRNGRARGSRDLDRGYRDGVAAGDRVSLNRGLRGGGAAAGYLT